MAAGLAMLKAINSDKGLMNRLEEKTKYLGNGIADALNKNNVSHTINRIGSMISVHFSEDPVVDFESAAKGNNDTFKAFFHGMLDRGIYIAPSAFESWFITDALTYQDLNETIAAVEEIAKEL